MRTQIEFNLMKGFAACVEIDEKPHGIVSEEDMTNLSLLITYATKGYNNLGGEKVWQELTDAKYNLEESK